jgi:8-oxo-dGTP diphosphatase
MKDHHKNPTPTVDIIIENDSRILLVKRKNEPFRDQLVLPGGFVNEGETVEDAAKREAREETSLEIDLIEILGVYSDPTRDPRGHIMSTVFIARSPQNRSLENNAVAGDDAAEIEWINIEEIENKKLGFDHQRIVLDYKRWKKFGGTFWSSKSVI